MAAFSDLMGVVQNYGKSPTSGNIYSFGKGNFYAFILAIVDRDKEI